MQLILMYHRAYAGLRKDLLALKKYRSVFPGDEQAKSICLVFDDATYDFYSVVFPLLKELNMKAVLAVPVLMIPDQVTQNRIKEKTEFKPQDSGFCSWSEIKEMVESGHVHIASHSLSHPDLTTCDNANHELQESKRLLEEKLDIRVTTFVYPYGKMNQSIDLIASQYYPHRMRIGNALNKNWAGRNGLLYRINGERLGKITPLLWLKGLLKFSSNYVRCK